MNLLHDGARAFGLELTEAQLRAFQIYQAELLAWNQKFNLTSITEPTEIVSKHFLDSLSVFKVLTEKIPNPKRLKAPCLSQFPISNIQRLIDIGAGAGFPGLPIKIVRPQWPLTLLEATRKKCDFLEHMLLTLQLKDARVVWGRSETVGQQDHEREQYDLVVARAVAPMNVLTEYMLPFAKASGLCIAWKGERIEAELNAAKNVYDQLGGRLAEVRTVSVPGIEQPHQLIVVEKVSRTPKTYPRRAGVPSKRPLQ